MKKFLLMLSVVFSHSLLFSAQQNIPILSQYAQLKIKCKVEAVKQDQIFEEPLFDAIVWKVHQFFPQFKDSDFQVDGRANRTKVIKQRKDVMIYGAILSVYTALMNTLHKILKEHENYFAEQRSKYKTLQDFVDFLKQSNEVTIPKIIDALTQAVVDIPDSEIVNLLQYCKEGNLVKIKCNYLLEKITRNFKNNVIKASQEVEKFLYEEDEQKARIIQSEQHEIQNNDDLTDLEKCFLQDEQKAHQAQLKMQLKTERQEFEQQESVVRGLIQTNNNHEYAELIDGSEVDRRFVMIYQEALIRSIFFKRFLKPMELFFVRLANQQHQKKIEQNREQRFTNAMADIFNEIPKVEQNLWTLRQEEQYERLSLKEKLARILLKFKETTNKVSIKKIEQDRQQALLVPLLDQEQKERIMHDFEYQRDSLENQEDLQIWMIHKKFHSALQILLACQRWSLGLSELIQERRKNQVVLDQKFTQALTEFEKSELSKIEARKNLKSSRIVNNPYDLQVKSYARGWNACSCPNCLEIFQKYKKP